MTRNKAIVLGLLTVWPLLYGLIFMAFVFGFILLAFTRTGGPGAPGGVFLVLIPVHMLTIVEIWGLIAYYIYHLFKNDRVPQNVKVLWAVILFLGSMFAAPAYWYIYIWAEAGRGADGGRPGTRTGG